MILQWILVIIAAWAVVASLSFLVIYAVIIISSRKSRQEEDRADEAPASSGGIGPAQIGESSE